MAITIVTGTPGAGKSIYAISLGVKAKKEGLNVFQIGIDGMDPKVISPSPVDIEHWDQLPVNSVLIVDEAHKYFPVRSPGKPPEYIQKLTEIRHFGVKLILVTQDPRNIDAFIRRLIGEHIHLSRKMGFPVATVHTFQGLAEDPNDYHSRRTAVASVFKYPSGLYKSYTSSTLHMVRKKVPLKMIFFLLLIVAFPILLYRAYYVVHGTVIDPKSTSTSDSLQSPGGQKGKIDAWSSPKEAVRVAKPLLQGVPWTAPVFSDTLKVKAEPKLYCVIIGEAADIHSLCRCYSEQITRIEASQPFCHDVALHGLYNPYQQPLQTQPIQPYAASGFDHSASHFDYQDLGGGPREAFQAVGAPSSVSVSDPALQVPPGSGILASAPVYSKQRH